MANIQININKNKTTTLATKGTYNNENIDIITNIPPTAIDGSALAADVLTGKTFYNTDSTSKVTGTMVNNGAIAGTISTKEDIVNISQGYHNGSGTVSIATAEQDKLLATNIRAGVTILGVVGNLEPGKPDQEKSCMPSAVEQIITADAGYELTKVTVAGDADLVSGNIKSGISIFGVAGSSSVVDTSDADAIAGNILINKTAYVNGSKLTGTMANNGAGSATISTKAQSIALNAGYYDGTGSIAIDSAEQAKIISDNIKSGVTILGVSGNSNVVNTSDATATAASLLSGATAYVGGNKITGTILNYDGTVQPSILVLQGGTATGITTATYSATEQAAYKQELISGGMFLQEELTNAAFINISGTNPGTIILDISELGNAGDYVKLMHYSVANNAWEVVYDATHGIATTAGVSNGGVIPADGKITITVSAFSPFVGAKLVTHTISGTVTNMVASPTLPQTVVHSGSKTFNFTPNPDYTAPDTITVGVTTVTAGAGSVACYDASSNKICDAVYTKEDISE